MFPLTTAPSWFARLKSLLSSSGSTSKPSFRPEIEVLEKREVPSVTLTQIGTVNSASGFGPSNLVNVNGTLFFSANGGTGGYQLWESNGTAAGTVQVGTFNGSASNGFAPTNLTNVNGTLFFDANGGSASGGYQLWQSNGTAAGTTQVGTFNSANGFDPESLVNVNGKLFFAANAGTGNFQLWQSNGTAAGTTQITTLNTSATNGFEPESLVNVNGKLFFAANDGAAAGNFQLWQSNGTAAGTSQIGTFNNGASYGFAPFYLTNFNDTVFFAANGGANAGGYQVWESNGTAAGTVQVTSLNSSATYGFAPASLTNVNGTLFFSANGGTGGYQLWQSNGTNAGTTQVGTFNSSYSKGFAPSNLVNVNGTLFFGANGGSASGNYQLWQSNGSAAGTFQINTINSANGFQPESLTNLNGALFFAANGGTSSGLKQLWTATTASQFYAVGADAGGGPQVTVYDAATNQVVASFFAFTPTFTGGVRVAVDEINGIDDIICAAGPGGGPQIVIYNGSMLNEVQSNGTLPSSAIVANFYAFAPGFTGGVFVAAGTSSSGQDWIAAGAGAGASPQVVVWTTSAILAGSAAGTAPTTLTSFYAFLPTFTGGVTVALGDANGDGKLDLIAGAGPGGGPQVLVVNGAMLNQFASNGTPAISALLGSFYAFLPSFTGGVYVSGGIFGSQFDLILGPTSGAGPQVVVANGSMVDQTASNGTIATSAIIDSFFAFPTSFGGGVRVGYTGGFSAGNGSSPQPVVLAGAGPGGGPEVAVFGGSNFSVLSAFFALPLGFSGGVFVAG